MARRDAPPSFQFYPADWLSSTAVAAMCLEARGAYMNLLCHAWLQENPGHLPDDDTLLAALSGLGDRWPEHRTAIRRAFAERSGELVQRRMVDEREAQRQRYLQAAKGAAATNAARWGKVAQRSDSVSHSGRPSVSPSSSSSSSSSTESRNGRLVPDRVSAAGLARCKERFPELDVDLIEVKMLAHHDAHPYKNLNRALANWCKKAQDSGWDRKSPEADATETDIDRMIKRVKELEDERKPQPARSANQPILGSVHGNQAGAGRITARLAGAVGIPVPGGTKGR